MAVANFQYITRMSSGFKVYILEGQPHLRSEDRYRHMANDRAHAPTVYPIKRKRSYERGLTLEERRERAMSRSSGKVAQKSAPAPMVLSSRQMPISTQNPTGSPTNLLPAHVYYAPVMDEPLALIKKPRKDPDATEETTKSTAPTQIQVRPSVITRVSSLKTPSCRSEVYRSNSSSVIPKSSYDHVLEEHFQRSLGVNYQNARSQNLSISVSVDDHFAKALGDKWLQIRSKSSSCSSTPPSSPSVTQSPTYSNSPSQCHKRTPSSSSPSSSHWPSN